MPTVEINTEETGETQVSSAESMAVAAVHESAQAAAQAEVAVAEAQQAAEAVVEIQEQIQGNEQWLTNVSNQLIQTQTELAEAKALLSTQGTILENLVTLVGQLIPPQASVTQEELDGTSETANVSDALQSEQEPEAHLPSESEQQAAHQSAQRPKREWI